MEWMFSSARRPIDRPRTVRDAVSVCMDPTNRFMKPELAHSNVPIVPHRQDINGRADAFLIRNFLSAAECAAHIVASEARGFDAAAISTAYGQMVVKDVRNNDRILWDDAGLAADWWARCRPFVPAAFGQWRAYGADEPRNLS